MNINPAAEYAAMAITKMLIIEERVFDLATLNEFHRLSPERRVHWMESFAQPETISEWHANRIVAEEMSKHGA